MKTLVELTASLVDRINSLISHIETEHPGMQDVAAMVYVGDVYALREQRHRRRDDGWGHHHYSCDSLRGCRRLP